MSDWFEDQERWTAARRFAEEAFALVAENDLHRPDFEAWEAELAS